MKMIGRDTIGQCAPSNMDKNLEDRYKRCIFTDMKIAIDCLKELDDKLKTLHPDVYYKIVQII
jgi:hypothetical protein